MNVIMKTMIIIKASMACYAVRVVNSSAMYTFKMVVQTAELTECLLKPDPYVVFSCNAVYS